MYSFPQLTRNTLWRKFAWVGAIIFEGNLWWGCNCPGGQFSGGQFPSEAIIRGAIFLGGNWARTIFDEFYEISPNSYFLFYSSYFAKYSLTAVFKANFELNGCFLIYALLNSS